MFNDFVSSEKVRACVADSALYSPLWWEGLGGLCLTSCQQGLVPSPAHLLASPGIVQHLPALGAPIFQTRDPKGSQAVSTALDGVGTGS